MEKWIIYRFYHRKFEVNAKGQIRNENGVILLGSLHKKGFRALNLKLKDVEETTIIRSLVIHRVVASCWIENPLNKPFVIHKDGNLLNNKIENLMWATQAEKLTHQKDIGRYGNFKLCTEDVLKIRRLLKKATPIATIALEFKVSQTQIQRIKRGENW